MKTNTPTKIEKISIGRLNGYRMYSKSSSVQIISGLGCNVNSLILNNQNIIDGNTDEEKLSSNYFAKSALLIPFPNRIDKGLYIFEGKKYQLPINKGDEGHAIHGLVYDKPFKLANTHITKNSISASFFHKIDSMQYTGYPFDLALIVTFTLENNQLTISVSATNSGNSLLPYGIGWHPYLKINKKIDRCTISIPGKNTLEIDKKNTMIPSGRLKYIQQFNNLFIGKAVFDACFTNLASHETRFENTTVFQDHKMQYLQIYTPADRQSIAIEPMSCAPNAFNNKIGLISLAPLANITHSFGIRVNL